MPKTSYIVNLVDVDIHDTPIVGGKNASLGEMIKHLSAAGVRVPGGFATTAAAYWHFLAHNDLDKRITQLLQNLNSDNVPELMRTGDTIRQLIREAKFPDDLAGQISEAYRQIETSAQDNIEVAVRSSATAEDLPEASFAGQQESYLNVCGVDQVLEKIRFVFASLFNDRAISYRVHQNFSHHDVALSAGVQRMVRSDQAASGVMFTIDTESGFEDVVLITSSYGLGEPIVQGQVNPDEFYVFKPALHRGKDAIIRRQLGSKEVQAVFDQTGIKMMDVDESRRISFSIDDASVTELAHTALKIEQHYQRPMDIEWAQDALDGQLYIVQARPETVMSNAANEIQRFRLNQTGPVLVTGRSIGHRIGAGKAKIIRSVADIDSLQAGDVLVTEMTDPDWEPVMKRAAAIVTDRGGRTCHAAIIARELGVPAIVGSGDGTQKIQHDQPVTVSCAQGDTGYVYEGELDYSIHSTHLQEMPDIPCKMMMNVGNPERAMTFSRIPNDGVGLARLEFIINQMVGIHPRALLELKKLPQVLAEEIQRKISAYSSPRRFYIDRVSEGVASIAAAFYPKPVIVRLSDFKSNEYANLLGGDHYEPKEENPMLGFRGAARYLSDDFKECFQMECEALNKVRQEMGFENVQLMVPFVRTVDEGKAVIDLLAKNGHVRGKHNLKIIMMCEIPSNALLADEFLEHFDGFSIGSNDLTQMTLAVDRDSSLVAQAFDERNPAVKKLIKLAIDSCLRNDKYIGICGQGPSDHPDLAVWLVEQGVQSLSLNPDTLIDTQLRIANSVNLSEAEKN